MSDRYFVRVRGRTLGPYDLDAIQKLARKAQVGRAHEVSVDGTSWASASAFPEIFDKPQNSAAAVVAAGLPDSPPSPEKGDASGVVFPPPAGGRGLMWHYTMAGQQQGTPVDQQSLINLIAGGHVGPSDSVWNETMSDWQSVSAVPALAPYVLPTPGPAGWAANPSQDDFQLQLDTQRSGSGQAKEYQKFIGKKTVAGIMALLLGNLGVHKFMLGLTTGGLTMLLLFCLLIPIPVLTVISFIEGILYLTKSDEQFFRDYAVMKKQWF